MLGKPKPQSFWPIFQSYLPALTVCPGLTTERSSPGRQNTSTEPLGNTGVPSLFSQWNTRYVFSLAQPQEIPSWRYFVSPLSITNYIHRHRKPQVPQGPHVCFVPSEHSDQQVSLVNPNNHTQQVLASLEEKSGKLCPKNMQNQLFSGSWWCHHYLFRLQARGDPCILLQSTAWVVVRSWIPLEVKHELRDCLLHLQRHNCYNVLFLGALTVKANLPARWGERKRDAQVSSALSKKVILASHWPAEPNLNPFLCSGIF